MKQYRGHTLTVDKLVKGMRVNLKGRRKLPIWKAHKRDYASPFVVRTAKGWVLTYGATGPFKTRAEAESWYINGGR